MDLLSSPTPRDFGSELKRARESAGVSLETIAEKTKIAHRVLEDIEAGQFARLPNRVFVRSFLQQYLRLLKENPDRWLRAFEAVWDRFESASKPRYSVADTPARGRRGGPWLLGFAVVAVALAVVVFVERRQNGERGSAVRPTPEALFPTVAEAPTAVPEPPPPTPTPDPALLVVRATDRPCWVRVLVAGRPAASRTLAAGEAWEIATGGGEVSLVLGDGGAASMSYQGETRDPLGAAGEVVHLRLEPSAALPGTRP